MSLTQAHADKLDAQIREWKATLAQLRARADQASADARIRYHEEVNSLAQRLATLEQKWKEVQNSSAEAWQDVRSGLEAAWEDFRRSMEQAKTRFDR